MKRYLYGSRKDLREFIFKCRNRQGQASYGCEMKYWSCGKTEGHEDWIGKKKETERGAVKRDG
jgi:hypothetical protein